LYDQISTKSRTAAEYPHDLWLYLDREYQLFSGTDETYHEWFVHAPVQANGSPPRNVLLLGGGDGLAIREVLKYDTVQRVVHVDIDPVMLRLARDHPLLSKMNGGVYQDARVEVVQADAFQWLGTATARFDAVYIDMPAARDYNLSFLYSHEFYTMVHRRLASDGFVAVDTPSGWCATPDNLWVIYYNTLRAAGFETVVPMLSRIDLQAPSILSAVDQMACERAVDVPAPGARSIRLTDAQARLYFHGALEEELQSTVHEFALAFPRERAINTQWRDDLRVPYHLFGPHQLPVAFRDRCPTDDDPSKVNSIFRPTLPELHLLSIRFP
jgi:spermidine synthase